MNYKDIEETLPNGRSLPEAIRAICEFNDMHGYPISGCFELSTIGMDDLKGWFPDDPQTYNQFSPFGRGACGDVYAIWLHSSELVEDGPVVMFGSEGDLAVLASGALEFCRLLCLGYSEVGLDSFDEPPSEPESVSAFQAFMIDRFGFEVPASPIPIVNSAVTVSPDFKEFVESRQPW